MEIIGTLGVVTGFLGFVLWLSVLAVGVVACSKSDDYWLNKITEQVAIVSAVLGYVALICLGMVLWGFIFHLVFGG